MTGRFAGLAHRWAACGAALVLAVGGTMTYLAVARARVGEHELTQVRFDHEVAQLKASVVARMRRPRYSVGDLTSVSAALGDVPNVAQFRRSVLARDLATEFPGVLGLGLIVEVPRAELRAFETRTRAEYGGRFAVRTSGVGPTLYVVRSVEPLDTNQQALGFDLGTDVIRQATLERAARTDELTLSPPLHLLQVPGDSYGALYILPAFPSSAPGAHRRGAWIYAAVHYPSLLAEISLAGMSVDFSVADVSEQPARELFDSGDGSAHRLATPAAYRETSSFELGGRHFVLTVTGGPALDAPAEQRWPWLLGVLGTVISLLLALAAWLLIAGRQRAVALARAMTQELDRLAMVGHLTMDGVLVADAAGRVIWANPAFYRVAERTADQVMGLPIRDFVGQVPTDDVVAVGARAAALDGRASFHGETHWLASDGSPIWYETEIHPIHPGSRGADGVVVIQTDITARREAESRLRESQRFLDRTGEAAGVGGWQIDLINDAIAFSEHTRRVHELPDDFVVDLQNGLAFFPAGARERLTEAVAIARATGKGWDLELPFVTYLQSELWVRSVGLVEFDGDRAVRITGALQDITQRKRLELDLEQNRELLRVTLDSIGDAVITTDPTGVISWMNPVAEILSGWSVDEAKGRPITEILTLVSEETRRHVSNPVLNALRDQKIVGLAHNTLLIARDGTEYGVDDSAAPIFDAFGKVLGAVMVFHDVTETRAINREMIHHARHDLLTGLPNRNEFEARASRFLDQAHLHGGEGVVMFLDLDHFKIVNDSCGHFAGDELLRQVGSIIKSSVRSFDTVARLGGDEFAVMLENCSAGQGEIIARDICSAMEHYRYLAPNGQGYRVGVSIGVASIDLAGHSLEHLLQAADNACYAAKTEGRSRHHVWSPEDGGIQSRAGETAWGVEVERALDADAFEIYAQRLEPRSTRALSHAPGMACEILVRMRLPDGRIVAPGAFMHAAERYQLASLIDRWVVQAVFNLFSDDADHARGVTHIGINLSGQSIGDTSFHDFVRGVVERARFDVGIVCFEITETAAITNLAAASLFLNDMRNRGIRIALDDFGAGFSSFGYLKSLCVDYLKIDGQFVTGVASSPIDRVSVKSFCEVARVLGIETIAEYVEDGETLRVLDELGVDYAQGYHVHVPEPILDLLAASAAGAY